MTHHYNDYEAPPIRKPRTAREAKLERALRQILPVVNRKIDAGECIHDIWHDREWRTYRETLRELLGE